MTGPPQTLADTLAGSENAPALFPVGRTSPVSRGQLRNAVYELASTLQQSGIRKGDVVSIAEANTVCPHLARLSRARADTVTGRRLHELVATQWHQACMQDHAAALQEFAWERQGMQPCTCKRALILCDTVLRSELCSVHAG